MSGRGGFVVLEGGEGVGKTTQVALLSARLEEAGVPHVVAREPGGTPVGEAIRSVVLDRTDLSMPPETELLLILAARAAFVREVVEPALAAGDLVVADRFALSTFAYQGHARGLDVDEIRRANALATGGVEPDLYVVLDLPVDEGAERRSRARVRDDRIEQEGVAFLQAVRDGYLALAADDPRVRVVSARGTPESVHQRITSVLAQSLPQRFGALAGQAGRAHDPGEGRGTR